MSSRAPIVTERAADARATFGREWLTPLSTALGTTFLAAYMVFHGLHVLGRDPTWVRGLSPVPFFATCAASAINALGFGSLCTFALLGNDKLLASLPRVLALSVALFTCEMVLLP
jgi:hypothetical protein